METEWLDDANIPFWKTKKQGDWWPQVEKSKAKDIMQVFLDNQLFQHKGREFLIRRALIIKGDPHWGKFIQFIQ